jgi:hypothetical protein
LNGWSKICIDQPIALVLDISRMSRKHFEYEESERHEKEKAATLRNLALSYTGNLTWYLTPIHISFLVCYCIFLVDLVVFGILRRYAIK